MMVITFLKLGYFYLLHQIYKLSNSISVSLHFATNIPTYFYLISVSYFSNEFHA